MYLLVLYSVYKISNGKDIFTKISQKENRINNPRFNTFKIKNSIEYISCSATDSVESILSTEINPIYDDINIEVMIYRYKFVYAIVRLSGRGLMSIHGFPKYVEEEILSYIKSHIKKKYDIIIDFKSFEYDNSHFSKDYWGNEITTKLGYNSSNRMYIKISCINFDKLLEKHPDLDNYYKNGIIKSIKGRNPDLEFIQEDKRYPGNFKFNRDGFFKNDYTNMKLTFFNEFLMKLIDNGFFGES